MGAKKFDLKPPEEPENHERWLVSYADFITLLFAFFVVLYATSEANLRKQEEIREELQRQFSGLIGSGQPDGDFNTNNQDQSLIAPPLPTFPPVGAGVQEMQDYVEAELKRQLSEEEYDGVIGDIRHDSYGVRIQLAASGLFDSGSADVKEDARLALEKIGRLLRDSNRKLIIEGHTDSAPIKSERFASNWELSATRATTIVRFLESQLKIAPRRLVPVAYGQTRPVASNESAEGRAKNRRIEIMIASGDEMGF